MKFKSTPNYHENADPYKHMNTLILHTKLLLISSTYMWGLGKKNYQSVNGNQLVNVELLKLVYLLNYPLSFLAPSVIEVAPVRTSSLTSALRWTSDTSNMCRQTILRRVLYTHTLQLSCKTGQLESMGLFLYNY